MTKTPFIKLYEPKNPLTLEGVSKPTGIRPLNNVAIIKNLEPILRPFKKLIKPIDSSNPDEMQLDLVTNLCYRIKAKIFKKKLDKNNFTPNIYKQALKSPNIKKWLAATFSEFEQLINLKTLKFLPYKVLPKGRKPLTNRLVFKEKKDQYDVTIKFKTQLMVKSFIQIKKVDYFETFASTIIPSS